MAKTQFQPNNAAIQAQKGLRSLDFSDNNDALII